MMKNKMTIHHRINVWRIADKCPVCKSERDYSPANPGGIECYCSNEECGYSEFFPTSFIHVSGGKNDNARFEVLDSNNNIKPGWSYSPSTSQNKSMKVRQIKMKERREYCEKTKNRIYANACGLVHCRKNSKGLFDGGQKIGLCKKCPHCKEYGSEKGIGRYSDCVYQYQKAEHMIERKVKH